MLRAEALDALRGSAMILHAGDIGAPRILDALRQLAPVHAVRGNNDREPWADALAEALTVQAGHARLHLLHDRKALDPETLASGVDAVITGHSHQPGVETRGGVLYVNPGSAGPRRFRLPVTLARLTVDGGRLGARILSLL